MKRFTRSLSFTSDFLLALRERAAEFKSRQEYPDLEGKLLGNIFFNPSLRTKLSFETAMSRSGGQALTITPGSGTWGFETQFGVRMNQDRPEHLKEAVRVMSRFVDFLGVRSFASLTDQEADFSEEVLSAVEQYATVPVVSLESACQHPCQMLGDMLTMKETLNESKGKNFCLRWAPHIKPLPMAVPHSSILAAAHLGMNITVAAPAGYELHPEYISKAQSVAESHGATLTQVSEIKEVQDPQEILYVKSWGAAKHYGSLSQQEEELRKLSPWMVRGKDLGNHSHLMHCLPVRRNVVASDDALDHSRSLIIEQAENRLWAQLAILEWLAN